MTTKEIAGALTAGSSNRARFVCLADGLAAAVAVSLPWSTSVTSILIVLWLLALVPTLNVAGVRRELLTAAGGLPVLLWLIGVVGTFWADVTLSERLAGLDGFHKLLIVPLLLAQFRASERGWWVILGFFASVMVLLVVSWVLVLIPGLRWQGGFTDLGIPVKDYIWQSGEFTFCAFAVLAPAVEFWRSGRRDRALALVVIAALLLANIFYVATARTTLVVIAAMILLFGLLQSGWKGAIGAGLAGCALASMVWVSSPYLRERVTRAVDEVQAYSTSDTLTSYPSSGYRLEFWRRSIAFIRAAPLIGHGTGTIEQLFRASASGEDGFAAQVTPNPHNMVLAVAIQIGALGTIVLVAMWAAHVRLFGSGGVISWFGLILVVQNIVGSSFNSHLFDFTQGWFYVFGVGVLGGMAVSERATAADVGGAVR